MKFFTKQEATVVLIILFVVGVVSFRNFQLALRRSRDSERKQDLTRVADALNYYHEDFGFFPPSTEDGTIVACNKDGSPVEIDTKDLSKTMEEKLLEVFEPCVWGEDGLKDVSDPDYPPYMENLPNDPTFKDGTRYIYVSNTRRFQLYASLEGEDEDEYRPEIVEYGLMCGGTVCNFGKSSGQTPLDKSIEAYENELLKDAKQ
jgi:hypothetical protein